MKVTLIGVGGGLEDTLTAQARAALTEADLVLGAPRLLEGLFPVEGQRRFPAIYSREILSILQREKCQSPAVVYSGDPGFRSGAAGLIPLLEAEGMECRVLPGLSSVQLLSARLGRPWQDWSLYTAHGADCDPVAAVMGGKPAFFLTGGDNTPAALCALLVESGLGELEVTVGERLSYPDEAVRTMRAEECAQQRFDPLSVLLVQPAPRPWEGPLKDGDFLRGEVPMTKEEVRAVILSKLAVRREDTVWDVGAGTGAVSVALALSACRGKVYGVEYREEAWTLIEENRRRFGAWNLRLVRGRAPDALTALPTPNGVFIGGSEGELEGIIAAALEKNPQVRLCLSAITLETLTAALKILETRGLRGEVVQIGVNRVVQKGGHSLLLAGNPVFLVTAQGEAAL